MYNNDTSTYVSDEKLLNLRKVLNDVNPDIIGVQEDRKYIDSSNSKTSLAYLFNPVFPFQYSSPISGDAAELGTYIHSKMEAVSNGGLFYSNYVTRPKIEYATYAIGNKTLLFISTHLVANAGDDPSSQASIAKRVENLTELFGWVNGTLTLKDIDNNDVYCPAHDWCIITGDMNTITDTDKTNLATAASNANFILGNGGRLGWLQTALRYTGSMTSLDNIIVSDNVIINSFTSYSEWYDRLYSDHVPVMANLTLLDT
jgi:endonuclease/exonuclease/phosphatase family metal-dependent hydrolase